MLSPFPPMLLKSIVCPAVPLLVMTSIHPPSRNNLPLASKRMSRVINAMSMINMLFVLFLTRNVPVPVEAICPYLMVGINTLASIVTTTLSP